MSKKSKKSVGTKAAKLALDRPFEPDVWAEAERVASRYGFLIQPHGDVGYFARGLEMSTVFADAPTPEECVRSIREALAVAVAMMIEMGDRPPPPATDAARREQINIRVTAEEKLRMEEAADSRGFRGISDFVRATTLASIR